jgi:hypothetical protein
MIKNLLFTLLITNLFIFTCSNSFAAFPLLKFEEVSGDFMDGEGKAYAKNAKYDINDAVLSHKEIEVNFNRKEKNLVIRDLNTTVELRVIDFSFLNVFKSFGFNGMFLESDRKKFLMDIESIDLNISPKTYKGDHLKVISDLTSVNTDDLPNGDDIDVLDGIILNGLVTIKKLDFNKIDGSNLLGNLVMENPEREDEIKDSLKGLKKIPLSLRNFSLGIDKGIITGKILLDSWINANLYIGGTLEHLKKERVLLIKLVRAKLGYFSIKRLILKEIGKLSVDAITVEGNIIKVDLGKVLTNSIPTKSKA